MPVQAVSSSTPLCCNRRNEQGDQSRQVKSCVHAWQLLSLAVEKPWLALGELFTSLAQMGFRKCSSHHLGAPFLGPSVYVCGGSVAGCPSHPPLIRYIGARAMEVDF